MNKDIVKPLSYSADLEAPVKKVYLDTLFATQDNNAHRFEISVFRGDTRVDLSSATVSAYFIRYSDNASITLDGNVSDNKACVTLKKSCYNKAGQFAVIIKATIGDVTSTVCYAEGTIFTSVTDIILDEENVIPSLEDLLAKIDEMERAIADANAATRNANNATDNANNAAAMIDGLTVSASSGATAGATVSEQGGVHHIDFTLPKGEKGDKGDPGAIENLTINGKSVESGAITINAEDVGAAPSEHGHDRITDSDGSTAAVWKYAPNNFAGIAVTLKDADGRDLGTAQFRANVTNGSLVLVCTDSDGNEHAAQMYSTANPPPHPVASVNGKTGAVQIGGTELIGASKIQYGTVSAQVYAGGTATVGVTFPVAMNSAPTVAFATCATSVPAQRSAAVNNLKATGMDVCFENKFASDGTLHAYWLAIWK